MLFVPAYNLSLGIIFCWLTDPYRSLSRKLNPENEPFFILDILLLRVRVIIQLGSISGGRAPPCPWYQQICHHLWNNWPSCMKLKGRIISAGQAGQAVVVTPLPKLWHRLKVDLPTSRPRLEVVLPASNYLRKRTLTGVSWHLSFS